MFRTRANSSGGSGRSASMRPRAPPWIGPKPRGPSEASPRATMARILPAPGNRRTDPPEDDGESASVPVGTSSGSRPGNRQPADPRPKRFRPVGQFNNFKEMDWSGRWESNPRHSAWEADVLPLNYARSEVTSHSRVGGREARGNDGVSVWPSTGPSSPPPSRRGTDGARTSSARSCAPSATPPEGPAGPLAL